MRRGGARALAACVLLVLAAGASTVAFLGPPFYHFNDDAVMSTVVSGVGWIGGETHPSPRAAFIHLLLGRVLEALYAFRPTSFADGSSGIRSATAHPRCVVSTGLCAITTPCVRSRSSGSGPAKAW